MSLHDSLIVIASEAWQSAKGGMATRYSSDEAIKMLTNDILDIEYYG